jgi:hypothetical protein
MSPKPKRILRPRCVVIAGVVKSSNKVRKPNELSRAVGRSLCRAAQRAREMARRYGTPIYLWKNGKVVAVKP